MPSARRATVGPPLCLRHGNISIHALREEGDDKHALVIKLLKIFLSTPSARRATQSRTVTSGGSGISIHALREEGDQSGSAASKTTRNFYPRPPRGGRRSAQRGSGSRVYISIHALREEGDIPSIRFFISPVVFLSTPSARRATAGSWLHTQYATLFLSTPSARRATVDLRSLHSCQIISIHALREEGD